MQTYTAEIAVDRPRADVFEQLQRFEEYPRFMETADEVERIGDDRMRWTVSIGPLTRRYTAEITEERPNDVIAWRALEDDFKEAGEVRLDDQGDDRTLVRFWVAYDLDGPLLKGADVLGVIERKAQGDLERLKEHLERG